MICYTEALIFVPMNIDKVREKMRELDIKCGIFPARYISKKEGVTSYTLVRINGSLEKAESLMESILSSIKAKGTHAHWTQQTLPPGGVKVFNLTAQGAINAVASDWLTQSQKNDLFTPAYVWKERGKVRLYCKAVYGNAATTKRWVETIENIVDTLGLGEGAFSSRTWLKLAA